MRCESYTKAGIACGQKVCTGSAQYCAKHKDNPISKPTVKPCMVPECKEDAMYEWAVCNKHCDGGKVKWKFQYSKSKKTIVSIDFKSGDRVEDPIENLAPALAKKYQDTSVLYGWSTGRFRSFSRADARSIVQIYNREFGKSLVVPLDALEELSRTYNFNSIPHPPPPRPAPSQPQRQELTLDMLSITNREEYIAWVSRNHPDKAAANFKEQATKTFQRVTELARSQGLIN